MHFWVVQRDGSRKGEIWAVGRVFQHLEIQMINGFNSVAGRVWACIVMQQQHFLRQ